VVFVRDAGPEQPLADKPVASAVEPEEVQERPQEKATERKSDKARDETPDTALSLPALPSEPKKSTEESVRKDEPPQPAQPTSLTPKEIVARCGRSVALITGKLGSGSGFLLGPNVLATNAHVVKLEFLEDIHVYFPSAIAEDRGPSTPNAVFYENETRDLALISLRSALPPLELARDDEFAPGEEIVIIGSPGLAGGSPIPNAINQGILSTRLNDHGRTLYQLGASINPGNSGGPIFNSAGRVVGVALARGKGVEALAFSIPAGDVRVAMDIVAGQSQEKTLQATARHRAIVAFHRLDLLGSHFGAGLDQSVAGMVAAAQKKLPLQEGLKAARQLGTIKINDNVVNLAQVIATDTMRFTPGLEAAVSRVSSDPLVDQLVKDKLVELLKTCIEMKDYLDRPRGTLPAFQEKRTELISRHKRLVESLRNLLEANLR
jgi:hypothetical protein